MSSNKQMVKIRLEALVAITQQFTEIAKFWDGIKWEFVKISGDGAMMSQIDDCVTPEQVWKIIDYLIREGKTMNLTIASVKNGVVSDRVVQDQLNLVEFYIKLCTALMEKITSMVLKEKSHK